MERFTTLRSAAVPFARDSIDTDLILPARFLRLPRDADHGACLFRDLRIAADGTEVPDFPLIRSYSLPAGAAQGSTGRPKRWAKPRAARSAPGPANSPKCAQIGSDRSGSACTSSTHHSVSRCAKE